MKKIAAHQKAYFLGYIIIVLLLGAASYIQYFKGVNPCPLCILQRITFGLLGVIFIFGIIWSAKRSGQILFSVISLFICCIGILLAGRQVWLQHLPSQPGANCEVSLQYMLRALPFDQVLQKMFEGSSGCGQVGWELMSLSLAQWSLLGFIFFLLFSFWQLRR